MEMLPFFSNVLFTSKFYCVNLQCRSEITKDCRQQGRKVPSGSVNQLLTFVVSVVE